MHALLRASKIKQYACACGLRVVRNFVDAYLELHRTLRYVGNSAHILYRKISPLRRLGQLARKYVHEHINTLLYVLIASTHCIVCTVHTLYCESQWQGRLPNCHYPGAAHTVMLYVILNMRHAILTMVLVIYYIHAPLCYVLCVKHILHTLYMLCVLTQMLSLRHSNYETYCSSLASVPFTSKYGS